MSRSSRKYGIFMNEGRDMVEAYVREGNWHSEHRKGCQRNLYRLGKGEENSNGWGNRINQVLIQINAYFASEIG